MEADYRENCPDCGVVVGDKHWDGCDVERCTACKGQRLQCDCAAHDREAAKWTGYWPGDKECAERGWAVVFIIGKGWVACDPDAPGAMLDLNRWAVFTMTGKDEVPSECLTSEQVELLMEYGVPVGLFPLEIRGLDWIQLTEIQSQFCTCPNGREELSKALREIQDEMTARQKP